MKTNPFFAVSMLSLAVLSAPAMAADVSVYGRAHLSLDVLGDGGDNGLNVSSNSSRLGFRANHEVQEGLEVFMQLEQNVRFDQRGGDFATRDSFAGIRGDWGQLRVGSFDTPGKLLRARADVFNDRLADLRNMASGDDMSFDPRFRNGIHYRSPVVNDVSFDIQYSPHNQVNATTENEFEAISTAINFNRDGLWLALSYEMTEQGWGDPAAVRVAGSYWLNDHWQVIGFYQHASDLQFGDRDTLGGGARYRFGDYALMGQVYRTSNNDTADTGATMLAIGGDYYISRELTFYLIAGVTDNDDNATFSVSAGGRDTVVVPQPGNNATGLSLGFIYNF